MVFYKSLCARHVILLSCLFKDGENSDTLKEVVVPIIPRDLCNESYDDDPDDGFDEITETMICAGMTKRDSCQVSCFSLCNLSEYLKISLTLSLFHYIKS